MIFWISFFVLSVTLWICSFKVREKDIKKLTYFYVSVLWFMASFRYMIGTDYPNYVFLYNTGIESITDIFGQRTEPLFCLIVYMLNNIGFGYQMLFVVLETILLFFFYKGCRFYCKNDREMLLCMLIYGVFSIGFYLSLNIVRQVVSMSIVLYASKYLFLGKKKVFLGWGLAAFLFHYATAIFLLACFVKCKRVSFKYSLITFILAIGMVASGLNIDLIFYVGNFITEVVGFYQGYLLRASVETVSIPFSTIVFVFMYLFLLGKQNDDETDKNNMLYFMSYLYIILRLLLSMGDTNEFSFASVIYRISDFWSYFFIILLATSVSEMMKYRKSVLMIIAGALIVILSVQNFSGIVSTSEKRKAELVSGLGVVNNNIDYQMNFNIFK